MFHFFRDHFKTIIGDKSLDVGRFLEGLIGVSSMPLFIRLHMFLKVGFSEQVAMRIKLFF